MYIKKCPLETNKANTILLAMFYNSLIEARKEYPNEQRFVTELVKITSKLAQDYAMINAIDVPKITADEKEEFQDWFVFQSAIFLDKLETEGMNEEMKAVMGDLYKDISKYSTYKRLHTEFLKKLEEEYSKEPPIKKSWWQNLLQLVKKDKNLC